MDLSTLTLSPMLTMATLLPTLVASAISTKVDALPATPVVTPVEFVTVHVTPTVAIIVTPTQTPDSMASPTHRRCGLHKLHHHHNPHHGSKSHCHPTDSADGMDARPERDHKSVNPCVGKEGNRHVKYCRKHHWHHKHYDYLVANNGTLVSTPREIVHGHAPMHNASNPYKSHLLKFHNPLLPLIRIGKEIAHWDQRHPHTKHHHHHHHHHDPTKTLPAHSTKTHEPEPKTPSAPASTPDVAAIEVSGLSKRQLSPQHHHHHHPPTEDTSLLPRTVPQAYPPWVVRTHRHGHLGHSRYLATPAKHLFRRPDAELKPHAAAQPAGQLLRRPDVEMAGHVVAAPQLGYVPRFAARDVNVRDAQVGWGVLVVLVLVAVAVMAWNVIMERKNRVARRRNVAV